MPSRRALLALPFLARPARAQARPLALAAFSILADMLGQVAGEAMEVRALIGAEMDSHHFQPRPSDAEALRRAALVLRNGLGFEPWLDRLLRSTGYRGVVVTATEGLVPRQGTDGHGHGGPDPHAWQDVRNALAYVARIRDGLTAADPPREAAYAARAAAYAARLEALDAWVRQRLGAVPEAKRVMVTTHESFGYFAAAYGVRVLAPEGLGGETQPSAARIAAVLRQIREQGITAIFLEGRGSQAVMQQLARETGRPPAGRLYADTLSAPDGPAPDYAAMMRHNVELMTRAMLAG
ncbi:zinc ABC transporter substrate-binding protein [Siccirubricoccus sp. KC 17139]|uniref:Zinc ABC transporter substrate-binding protein n=1 Tax=Siccirubricoccus soli TaxID=2899147 RepID=A0ABT1D9D3_9PROT|nr:zinc ABC transporter substrate-binding protein [Siccirubricoccus soli]MCO6418217.1 zinc ABC transporter substrate-binding protein [Siccirubricoccus soli]MCP2684352.1 zinc ABC transporter substrate-binding protein [Siccirubricoccus soli]